MFLESSIFHVPQIGGLFSSSVELLSFSAHCSKLFLKHVHQLLLHLIFSIIAILVFLARSQSLLFFNAICLQKFSVLL